MKSLRELIARPSRQASDTAFTMTELLVILGTLTLLILMLAPALAAPKPNSKATQCLNNQRQLILASQMYSSDNADLIVAASSWVYNSGNMDWTANPANTNSAYLTNSAYALFASYIKSGSVYKCPADIYQSSANPGPRVRSVSKNAGLNGQPTFVNSDGTGRIWFRAIKETDLTTPGPANIFVFLDEHPDSIDDGIFAHNPGYPANNEHWRNLPASYHNGAAGISFADGHVDMHTWSVVSGILPTAQPVQFTTGGPWTSLSLVNDADYEWLENRMPYHF